MATPKLQTNEQMLKAFINSLDAIEIAILRERIIKIMEITKKDIQERPDAYHSPFTSPDMFLLVAEKAEKYMGFKN